MRQNYFKVDFFVVISCLSLSALFGQVCEAQVEDINSFSSFTDWCENKYKLDSDTIHTIDQLLLIAKTDDCKLANKRLNELTHLSLSQKKISSLAPLNSFRNLTAITLSENQVTDTKPLSFLTNLIALDISKNQIVNIKHLEKLVKLQRLFISDNLISDISPLRGMRNLKDLSAKRNQISDVSPLKDLTNLKRLFLDYNKIMDVMPLQSLKKIDIASFRGNPIIKKVCPFENIYIGDCLF
jgi:internalin A